MKDQSLLEELNIMLSIEELVKLTALHSGLSSLRRLASVSKRLVEGFFTAEFTVA